MAARSPVSPIFIAGPTAVGKSEVALALAERMGGEIISVDSMQVYRGLNLGTAKPSSAEQARAPHHLVDVVELTDCFDAARFCVLAREAEAGIRLRGRVPIFCGGTGLYFTAWFEGLGATPAADEQLRAELEATPLDELLGELAARDAQTFEQIDQKNRRRVVRAVEVIRLTGQPFSAQRARWRSPSANQQLPVSTRTFILTRPRAELHARISSRVDEMFRQGLVAETRELLSRGLEHNRTAMQAIGYRQVVEHLRGERGLSETIELVKLRTRQFAKRQMTWFRRHLSGTWFELNAESSIADVVEMLLPTLLAQGNINRK